MIQFETREFALITREALAKEREAELKHGKYSYFSFQDMVGKGTYYTSVHDVIKKHVNPYHPFYITETPSFAGHSTATITAVFIPQSEIANKQ